MTLFISSLCMVFLLGIQQQNVTHEHHGWSLITAYLIAIAQTAFLKEAVAMDYWNAVFLLGTGGALGASLSMVVHKRFIRRRSKPSVVLGSYLDY